MQVSVNGELRELRSEQDLGSLVTELSADAGASGIAVAVNGAVVRRDDWSMWVLAEGDRVEILSATAGG